MHLTAATIAAGVVMVLGIGILWANPSRSINRIVFLCSLHVVIWLLMLHASLSASNRLYWLRFSSCVGAMLPMHLWAVKETIANESFLWLRRWKSVLVWFVATLILTFLPFTDFYIPSYSRADARVIGAGYHLYIVGVILLYVALCAGTLYQIRRLTGIRRVELQVWLVGGTSAAVAVMLLMAANAIFHETALIRLQPVVIMTFFGGTVVAITVHRVFDARQLLLVLFQKCLLVGLVALQAYLLWRLLTEVVSEPLPFLVTTAVALWFAGVLNGWLDRMLHFYPQGTAARQAVFAVARRESRVENMEAAFGQILKGLGHTEKAVIISGGKGLLRGNDIELLEDSPVVRAMRQLRWATPERLSRERATSDRTQLAGFFVEHGLGVLVIGEGPTLTALAGVGVPASRRPFTYPQVTQLLELASIMESALERAHFSVKAQHAEQLATVGLLGASLAHEIRNPLVSIKTFVHLLPKHHHDPVFRQKFFGLIGDEVARIDRLTEQLLDLASPRVYRAEAIELHPVLRMSLELVSAKATDKRIEFLTEFQANPDRAFTDRSAAKQVLLNLCFNAIQAVEGQVEGPRWVKVATRNVPNGVEVSVEDSGPGISPAIRPRLFQPFQTTKSSGFGLGLAICSDILAGLDATIAVDPSVPGRGALFRIVFPCPA